MRSQNITALLEYEAKRQPALATMITNINHMSDDQINSAKVRLPWIRQALLRLKHERPPDDFVAQVLSGVVDSQVPDPVGEMRKWIGSNMFVRIDRTQLEINDGQLVWFDRTGVWIDSIHTSIIDPLLRTNTISCGQIRRTGYMEALRVRRQSSCMITPEPTSGIRFYHP